MMKHMQARLLAVLMAVSILFSFAACTQQPVKRPFELKERPSEVEYGAVGLDNLTAISSISRLNDNIYTYGDSSYCRENTNDDGFTSGNFPYVDEQGRYVICDAKGSGLITRIWMLATAVDGNESHLQVYIDGEETPTIDMSYNEFISGSKPPFDDVFCVRSGVGGVHVCYLTMEFEESMYAVMTGPNGFWQVDYHMVDDVNGDLQSMTGEENYAQERYILENCGKPLANAQEVFSADVTAKKGKTVTVTELTGKRQISYLEFAMDGLKLPSDLNNRSNENFREILNGLRLVIQWDGETLPSVDAPFGLLFGMGSFGYNQAVKSLMYGVRDDGTLYFYFPMPFEKSAKISIANDTGSDVKLSVKVGHSAVDSDFYNVGYFTTAYSNFYTFCQDPFEAVMLDVNGSGKVVSIQENIYGQVGEVWYEEGDHRFYIDGSITPQIIGTGTEDFYNGAGYFILNDNAHNKLGFHTLPFSGYTNYLRNFEDDGSTLNQGVSCYRSFVTDPINFRNGIKLTFEHGGGEFNRVINRGQATNQTAGYEALVCYYYQPVTKMNLTDTFVVSDAASAAQHDYIGSGDESYAVKSSFFGSFFMMQEEKTMVKNSGSISFTMAVDSKNYGAVLYRIYDQLDVNLGAAVYVDGEYVGEWYKAGQNKTFRFADDYFIIPESFTKGKTAVTITLEPNTESPWNAAEYRLYSKTDVLLEETQPAGGKVYTLSAGKQFLDHVDSEFDLGGSYKSNPVTVKKESKKIEQDFRLIEYADGSYFIICQGSGTVLSQHENTVIRKMYPNSKLNTSDLWELIPDGDKYLLRNKESGLYIAVSGNKVTLAEKGTGFTFREVTQRKACLF